MQRKTHFGEESLTFCYQCNQLKTPQEEINSTSVLTFPERMKPVPTAKNVVNI